MMDSKLHPSNPHAGRPRGAAASRRAVLGALLLAPLALGACSLFSSPELPRSEYFVIDFKPRSVEFQKEGQSAITRAAAIAARSEARIVYVQRHISASNSGRVDSQLLEGRVGAVKEALTKAGVDPAKVGDSTLDESDEAAFRFQDTLTIQIVIGGKAKPA